MKGHLILVGLPGAGKSTVGPLAARELGWAYLDLDELIEQRTGHSVADIFTEQGEAAFRELERTLTIELRTLPPMVLSPGGGWVTTPGNVELLRPPGTMFYLEVSVSTALSRMGVGVEARPLLAGPDAEGKLGALLDARKTSYLQANHTVSVEMLTPTAIAHRIVALARAATTD